MKTSGQGHGAGKVILLGEHAVVHDMTALALGLGRCVSVTGTPMTHGVTTLKVPQWGYRVRADGNDHGDRALAAILRSLGAEDILVELTGSARIPSRAGLGASAAVAAACCRAIADLKEIEPGYGELFEAVQDSERYFHGNPSGLDASAVLGDGMIEFSRSGGAKPIVGTVPELVIAYCGEGGSTRQMVELFAQKLSNEGAEGRSRLSAIGAVSLGGVTAIENDDIKLLGELMDENQRLLSWFGMSTPTLDRICVVAKNAGAHGAKLTGGGGGGCAVALVNRNTRQGVEQALEDDGFQIVVSQ